MIYSQTSKKNTLNAQKAYLESIRGKILSPDGKKVISAEFLPLAKARTAATIQALAATAKMIALTKSMRITDGMIRYYKKETMLDTDHVKDVFTKAGFEIVSLDLQKAYPKFPPNADKIHTELAAFRTIKNPNPDAPDSSVVMDLYGLAAYLENDLANVAAYRNKRTKSTAELIAIFEPAARKFSQRNDDLGKILGTLTSAAKTYVFVTDEQREAYDRYLLYHNPALTALFGTLRAIPDFSKRDPDFAGAVIKKILEYFPNYDTALAIYNKEAKFPSGQEFIP